MITGPEALERAQVEEREFVHAFGGFSLEIPGAVLVTNERIPVPRFNAVSSVRVARERMAGFFERALDHYYQRALRPMFRVPKPVAPEIERSLRHFGFRPAEHDSALLLQASPFLDTAAADEFTVREARPPEIDLVVGFWMEVREREEFRRALEVVWHHPNPDESIRPFLALRAGEAVSAALVYRHGRHAGIHNVATQVPARGQGAATALVAGILRTFPAEIESVSIRADHPRIRQRLERLDFELGVDEAVFVLPAEAQLVLPGSGTAGPPRWRPPRNPPARADR
jgi:hypothetical protein